MQNYPSYLKGFNNSTLKAKIEKAYKLLESCTLCPRKCRVNRINKEKGFCRVGLNPVVCSFMPHHGEEPPISGTRGSGTIFFSFCNLKCLYCQNYNFSQEGEGEEVSIEKLSDFMLYLQGLCCHNINLVTPTHVMPQILKALYIAIEKGLNIPIVYNTSGYELPEIIKILDGIVDIYLVDMRYGDSQYSEKYSQASNYPYFNQGAVKEMHRQVGDAEFDKNNIINKGLLVRHLVLPNKISGTEKIMGFLSKEISKKTYISLMSQYHPYYQAYKYPEISRRITKEEYQQALDCLSKYGLENGWIQDSFGLERFAGVNIKRNI
ncbi:MAG: radical SAM protein [Candidatus Omnitrophica bacterium]|nr:radical SAM protein [Candidatus Omnitrophota bacterium]